MTTPTQIEQAIGERLKATPGIPDIVWQNQDANPERPFVFMQHVPTARSDVTGDGGGEQATGYFTATVVIAENQYTTPALVIAEAIMAQFPYTLKISAGSGNVSIYQPPHTENGFRDGPDWRVPVRIDYQTVA